MYIQCIDNGLTLTLFNYVQMPLVSAVLEASYMFSEPVSCANLDPQLSFHNGAKEPNVVTFSAHSGPLDSECDY